MFADDFKLYLSVTEADDYVALQHDIDCCSWVEFKKQIVM